MYFIFQFKYILHDNIQGDVLAIFSKCNQGVVLTKLSRTLIKQTAETILLAGKYNVMKLD
jgi:hypothetical protein